MIGPCLVQQGEQTAQKLGDNDTKQVAHRLNSRCSRSASKMPLHVHDFDTLGSQNSAHAEVSLKHLLFSLCVICLAVLLLQLLHRTAALCVLYQCVLTCSHLQNRQAAKVHLHSGQARCSHSLLHLLLLKPAIYGQSAGRIGLITKGLLVHTHVSCPRLTRAYQALY